MDMNGTHRIEVEGRPALGFDTGLDPISFAQAKLAQLLSESGAVIASDGSASSWKAEGVVERDGRMTIWGPYFEGSRLDRIIAEKPADIALDALRRWAAALKAVAAISGEKAAQAGPAFHPAPAAAFIGGDGAVLFVSERVILRSLDAEGEAARLDGADRWMHPDLKGAEAAAFVMGALAYRVLCGKPPFAATSADAVRADMRDGCALPARLARPGLKAAIAALLDAAIAPVSEKAANDKRRAERLRPTFDELRAALGEIGSGGVDAFATPLTEAELQTLEAERDKLSRKMDRAVGFKRYTRRNAAVITAVAVSAVAAVFIGRGIVRDRAERPTTAGMSPRQVVQTYYDSFGTLDHMMMEACVADKAGKGDIEAATNMFVISRVREAYEQKKSVVSAEKWIASGSPPVDAMVYGAVDMKIEATDAEIGDGTAAFRVVYTLWRPDDSPMPDSSGTTAESGPATRAPVTASRVDELKLESRKGRWLIVALDRIEKPIAP